MNNLGNRFIQWLCILTGCLLMQISWKNVVIIYPLNMLVFFTGSLLFFGSMLYFIWHKPVKD